MKKRILITLTYYIPHISGLTIAVANLAELLAKNGYTISVLTTRHPKSLPAQEKIHGVRIKRMWYLIRIYKGFLIPFFCFQVIREILKNRHVLIILPQAEGFLIALFAKMLRRKVHVYYICNVVLDKNVSSRLAAHLLRFVNGLCLRLADTILALSDDYAWSDPLLKKYAGRVIAAHPIIKDISLENDDTHVLDTIPKKKYTIGFLGRIAREKGIHYLLESIPLLKKQLGNDFVIVIAGPANAVGEEAYSEKILSMIRANKDYVVYLGVLPEKVLGRFYTTLDVLVFPSTNATEAFGMVQVEAMRLGIPVIASDLPGVRVCVQQTGMGEIIQVRSSNAIADAIVKIVKKPGVYKKGKSSIDDAFSDQNVLRVFDIIFASEKSSLSDDHKR